MLRGRGVFVSLAGHYTFVYDPFLHSPFCRVQTENGLIQAVEFILKDSEE